MRSTAFTGLVLFSEINWMSMNESHYYLNKFSPLHSFNKHLLKLLCNIHLNVLKFDNMCHVFSSNFEFQVWVIDVSQSVEPSHPSALEFLLRDCTNVSKFFKLLGVSNVLNPYDLFNEVSG